MRVSNSRAVYALALAASTSACGFSVAGESLTSPTDMSGSSGGSSSSSGSSSGSSGGSSSGGSEAGDAGASDPEIAYSVTLKMDSFDVAAGQEVFMCQDFANPFQGQRADIKTYELHMSQGSHHIIAFYKPNPVDAPAIPCPLGGDEFGPFSFTAQNPDVIATYPEGVGASIPTDIGFMLNSHYTNPSATSLTGQVSLTMYVAKPGIVTKHAGVIFLNQLKLVIPASATPYTATATYVLAQDVNILTTNGHMHQRATNFIATASTGQTLYQTTQWAEAPNLNYSPPLLLKAGTTITWSCTYVNDTGAPLVFGPSAQTDVMCISASGFYPVSDVRNPVIPAF